MITLSERLQLELRNRDPSEVSELILDNSKANEIEGLDDSYVNLRELSLVNVGLTTLKGFPSLPSLEKLDLSDNKLSFGLDNLTKCPQLMQLLLTNNRIKSFKDIESLANLKNLEILDLFNCAISSEENYRKEIFALLPTLKYLDGFDEKNEEELNESEEYDEEEENEVDINSKDVYELSDDSGSEEEYESEDEVEIVNADNNSGKAANTRGKDMNLFNNEVVELTDDDGDDEVEEEEEYECEDSYDENVYDIVQQSNGKSKNADNYVSSECDEVLLSGNDDEESQNSLTPNQESIVPNGLKRNYDSTFLTDFTLDKDDLSDDIILSKQLKSNSDFELTDESSLLDNV